MEEGTKKSKTHHFDICVFLNNLEKYDTSIQIAQLIMEIWKFRSEWSNRPSPNNLRNIRLDTKQRNWCKKSGNPIPQVKKSSKYKRMHKDSSLAPFSGDLAKEKRPSREINQHEWSDKSNQRNLENDFENNFFGE